MAKAMAARRGIPTPRPIPRPRARVFEELGTVYVAVLGSETVMLAPVIA